MSDFKTFHDLSTTLPEKERMELLSKIKTSLNLSEIDDQEVFHSKIGNEELTKLINQEMKTIPLHIRIILWIKRHISSKNKADLFIELKMKDLKKMISRKSNGLTGFETRNLTPKFAEILFGIFIKTVPLHNFFSKLWSNALYFQNGYLSVLESRIPNVKKNLEDLISIDDIVEIYHSTGMKEFIKNEVLKRIDKYIRTIPKSIFSTIEQQIMPLYYLKDLILFQYVKLFQLFNYTPIMEDLSSKPIFKNASAMLCLDSLEKLLSAMKIAAGVSLDFSLDNEVIKNIFFMINQEQDDPDSGNEEPEENIDQEIDDKESMIKNIEILIKHTSRILDSLPLDPIIKYFRKDPYYKLIFYIPKINLKDFFHSALKLKFLTEIDDKFPEIRKMSIDKEIKELFKDKTIIPFHHFREYRSLDYKKLGLPVFIHVESLNLIYNYTRWYFKNFLQDPIVILNKGMLAHNRITKDRMLQYASGIEEIQDKIKQFDYSLSPDSEDGKMFQRLRFSLAAEASYQKMYLTLVMQKNKEVKELLLKAEESLNGLSRIFAEILSSPSGDIKMQLSQHYMLRGRSYSLTNILTVRREHMQNFVRLVNQLVKMEEG